MTHRVTQVETLGAQSMTYGGGGTAIAGGYYGLNEWGIIIGIIVGLVGLATQIWLAVQRNRREKELHRKRMNDKADLLDK